MSVPVCNDSLKFSFDPPNGTIYDCYFSLSAFLDGLRLTTFDHFLIAFVCSIFMIGIVGNALVIIVVIKNAHMRTITNILIVNLAIGDFLVILICLPATVFQDVTQNWVFGEVMCKLVVFVQYISVCVSVMTLTVISYERFYAIVYPLKFQATMFRAKIILMAIWVLSVIINLPHPIVIKKGLYPEYGVFYCYPSWENKYQNIFEMCIFIILYIVPMILISYTYTRVVKVLWRIDRSIAFDEHRQSESSTTTTTYTFANSGNNNKKRFSTSNNNNNNETRFNGNVGSATSSGNNMNYVSANNCGSSLAMAKMKNQLIARRKAAKMLISVAVLFAICYIPIHTLNVLRYAAEDFLKSILSSDAQIKVTFQIAHVLVYVNSCVNPLIYYFMSDNFRKEFQKILFCNMLNKEVKRGGGGGGPISTVENNRRSMIKSVQPSASIYNQNYISLQNKNKPGAGGNKLDRTKSNDHEGSARTAEINENSSRLTNKRQSAPSNALAHQQPISTTGSAVVGVGGGGSGSSASKFKFTSNLNQNNSGRISEERPSHSGNFS